MADHRVGSTTSMTEATEQDPDTQAKHSQDSGYGTNQPSPNRANDNQRNGTLSLVSNAIPFPLSAEKDLLIFKTTPRPAAVNRFNEIVPEIERLLLDYIKSAHRIFADTSPYQPMAIRLAILGRTEDDAKECLVVLCPPNQLKRVQEFFKSKIAKELCEPEHSCSPCFKVIVTGVAPRPRGSFHAPQLGSSQPNTSNFDHYDEMSLGRPKPCQSPYPDSVNDLTMKPNGGLSSIEVYSSDLLSDRETLCGCPIQFVNGSGETRSGTFGGIVKIARTRRDFELYGLTTGHGLVDWQTAPDTTKKRLEEPYEENAWVPITVDYEHRPVQPPLLTSNFHPKPGAVPQLENFPLKIGNILEVPQDHTNEYGQYLDWALFELDASKSRPNCLPSSQGRKRDLTLLRKLPAQFNVPKSVIMMNSSQGYISCSMSTMPARLILGPGLTFVDTYLVSMVDGFVSDGSSGSWVIDPLTFEVYGHVVATDILGDAYVMPLSNVFSDIQNHLGVQLVDLPSIPDFAAKLGPTTTSPASPTPSADRHLDMQITTPDPYLDDPAHGQSMSTTGFSVMSDKTMNNNRRLTRSQVQTIREALRGRNPGIIDNLFDIDGDQGDRPIDHLLRGLGGGLPLLPPTELGDLLDVEIKQMHQAVRENKRRRKTEEARKKWPNSATPRPIKSLPEESMATIEKRHAHSTRNK